MKQSYTYRVKNDKEIISIHLSEGDVIYDDSKHESWEVADNNFLKDGNLALAALKSMNIVAASAAGGSGTPGTPGTDGIDGLDGSVITEAEVKTKYESNSDTECFTTAEQTKLGSIPSLPTGDGDYVLNVVGGVFTWGLNSGGALVYDAHILGSTLAGDITLSPFVKHGGVDEETRNRGVAFADGGIYLVYPMYQAGMSAAHIGDASPMFLADDYANASPTELFNGAGTSMGNPFNGSQMNAAIAAGNTLQIQYDGSSSKLLVEVV